MTMIQKITRRFENYVLNVIHHRESGCAASLVRVYFRFLLYPVFKLGVRIRQKLSN